MEKSTGKGMSNPTQVPPSMTAMPKPRNNVRAGDDDSPDQQQQQHPQRFAIITPLPPHQDQQYHARGQQAGGITSYCSSASSTTRSNDGSLVSSAAFSSPPNVMLHDASSATPTDITTAAPPVVAPPAPLEMILPALAPFTTTTAPQSEQQPQLPNELQVPVPPTKATGTAHLPPMGEIVASMVPLEAEVVARRPRKRARFMNDDQPVLLTQRREQIDDDYFNKVLLKTTSLSSPASQEGPQVSAMGVMPDAGQMHDDDDDDDESDWEDYYYQLALFKATKEHTNLPPNYVCHEDNADKDNDKQQTKVFYLGQWLARQRAALLAACYQAEEWNNNHQTLTSHLQVRIQKLSDIGFGLSDVNDKIIGELLSIIASTSTGGAMPKQQLDLERLIQVVAGVTNATTKADKSSFNHQQHRSFGLLDHDRLCPSNEQQRQLVGYEKDRRQANENALTKQQQSSNVVLQPIFSRPTAVEEKSCLKDEIAATSCNHCSPYTQLNTMEVDEKHVYAVVHLAADEEEESLLI